MKNVKREANKLLSLKKRLLFLILWCIFFAGAASLQAAEAEESSWEVMTLSEVSLFLKTDENEILRLIDKDCLPARQIGQGYRFSRKAVLEWLAEKEPYNLCGHHEIEIDENENGLKKKETHLTDQINPMGPGRQSDSLSKTTMPPSELSVIAGKGPAVPNGAPTVSKADEKIGERPTYEAPEDLLLLGEQVLLGVDRATLELGLFYSKIEQQGLALVPLNNALFVGFSEGEQDSYLSNLTFRYGLKGDYQLSVSVPYVYQENKTTAKIPGLTTETVESSERSEFGDIVLGLRHTLFRENVSRPDVIVKGEGYIPTGDSSAALAMGLSFLKRFDPMIIYSDLSYRHIFTREFDDVTRLQPKNIFQASLGHTISLNDRIAISTSVIGAFTSKTSFDKKTLPELPSTERFSLSLGMTNLISENLYLETSLNFSLTGPRSITLGITLPYSFEMGLFD